MDTTGALLLVSVIVLSVAVVGTWWIYQRRRVDQAKQWPQTDAIIESSSIEHLEKAADLPVFAFSYKVGEEYYSGRFALLPYTADPGESILTKLIGRTLRLRYDPRSPSVWFIDEDIIEGCRVEQKIGVYVVGYAPK